MRDIVATIRAEQDEIIRLDHDGVLVIEGGPGTGKTAVALHRVAYLLYAHRDRLARRGVLVIGPNAGFLDHVGDVVPSLGETSVVLAAPGDLFPGVRTAVEDEPRTKRVKGDLGMVDVLAAAVADRQEVPENAIPIDLDDVEITVDARIAASARRRARETGLLHNDAREVFRERLIEELVTRAVHEIGRGWLGRDDTEIRAEIAADARVELKTSSQVSDVVDRLWPHLTPQRLLVELFTSHARIETAATSLDERDRGALYQREGDAWTVSDVPLLDEAVEWLGRDRGAEERAERERRERVEYAEGVLDALDTDEELDGEVLRAVDLVDAETLSGRNTGRDRRAPPSARPTTASGPTATWSWTRPRSSPRWTGGSSCVAARASR